MAQICTTIQEKYVPTVKKENKVIEKVIFDGDQLTEERARNAGWANILAGNDMERLEGLETSFADWHLKRNLYQICYNIYFKYDSSAQIGTMCASMNRTGKSNAKKGPETDYNAFKDFFDRETEAHIISRWMVFVGMESMESDPTGRIIPQDILSWDKPRITDWLRKETYAFLNLVFLQTDMPQKVVQLEDEHQTGFACRQTGCGVVCKLHSARVRHEKSNHLNLRTDNGGCADRDRYGYYKCRATCGMVFTTNATRTRHEKTQHHGFITPLNVSQTEKMNEDNIWNYHTSRLQLGLYFLNMEDAIKHGDGYRLLRCYKFTLLLEYKYRHTKYAYLLLHFFIKFYAVLSQDEAYRLLTNRFINYVGGPGNNIPLDLHMEHLNLMLKQLTRNSGGNLTERTIQRNARSLSVIRHIMEGVHEDCNRKRASGCHGAKNPKSSVEIIVNDLIAGKVYDHQAPRKGYNSFENFNKNIIDTDYRDFFSWVRNTINHWKGIYEAPQHEVEVPQHED